MLRGDAQLEAALQGSHTVSVEVELRLDGRTVATSVPLDEGASVDVSASSFVRRTLKGTITEGNPSARRILVEQLTTPGMEILVRRGAQTVDGRSVDLPIHHGIIARPEAGWPSPPISFTSPDLGAKVAAYRFPQPTSPRPGLTIPQQIGALVREALPGIQIVDESGASNAVPRGIVWERNRNDAVSSLATSIGCETFLRPDGVWLIRQVPTIMGAPVHTFADGDNLSEASVGMDLSAIRNWIIAIATRADGVTIRAEAKDRSALSPTRVTGPMGPVTGFYASPFLTTYAQALKAALGILARSMGARRSVTLSGLMHPGLDCDRVDVVTPDWIEAAVIDSFSLPVYGGQITNMQCRSMVTTSEAD